LQKKEKSPGFKKREEREKCVGRNGVYGGPWENSWVEGTFRKEKVPGRKKSGGQTEIKLAMSSVPRKGGKRVTESGVFLGANLNGKFEVQLEGQ